MATGNLTERIDAVLEGRSGWSPVTSLLRQQLREGCGDHSCEFRKAPLKGMGTNGGCRCMQVIESALYYTWKQTQRLAGAQERE